MPLKVDFTHKRADADAYMRHQVDERIVKALLMLGLRTEPGQAMMAAYRIHVPELQSEVTDLVITSADCTLSVVNREDATDLAPTG